MEHSDADQIQGDYLTLGSHIYDTNTNPFNTQDADLVRGHAVPTNTGSHWDHHNGLRHQGDPPGSYIADIAVPWDTLADNLQTEVGSIPIWIPHDAGVMCYSEHSPDPPVQVTSFLTRESHQSQSHDWDIADTGYCHQDIDKFKQIYNHVQSSGQPNYCGALIIIPSGLNIPIWREYLLNSCYHDVAVCDMLAYGFPLNYCRDVYPITIPGNHPSAVQFPGHVDTYLDTEIRHGALLGPFTTPPITNVHTSPLTKTTVIITTHYIGFILAYWLFSE